LGNSNTKIN
jgi:hypothetical protein